MSLSDLFDSFTLFIQYIEKIKLPIQSWLSCHANPWVPFTHPYLGPWLVPNSPGNLLPLITPPQTPRLTLKPSWLKPHPGSAPGLDSPALPCRSSSTSLRWLSACAAGSPPKPEPRLHPHPTARPRLSPGLSATASLLTEKGRSWVRTLPLCPLPSANPPAPLGKTKVCVGSGTRVRLNREVRAVGVCRSPVVPAPRARGSPQPPFRAVHLSVWQAGWLAGWRICLSLCCWCA